MKTADMTPEQLDAWYDNIARVDAIPNDKRHTVALELCTILELANIEIRFED